MSIVHALEASRYHNIPQIQDTNMKPIPALQADLKNLVPLGIDVVIKQLKQSLPVSVPKYNDVIELEARYRENHKRLIKGTISYEDAEVESNQIREAILACIDALEEKDFTEITATSRRKGHQKGKIFYRIPGVMAANVETTCLVRIAFNEENLTYDITVEETDDIKELRRVSEVMSVELIDPSEASPFAIRRISEAVQFVEQGDYTEWQFFVKPLLQGAFPLLLKVSVIEIKQGRERKKDIVLEERVQIVSKLPEIAPDLEVFKQAGAVFQMGEPHSNSVEENAKGGSIIDGGQVSEGDSDIVVADSEGWMSGPTELPQPSSEGIPAPGSPSMHTESIPESQSTKSLRKDARGVFRKMAYAVALLFLTSSIWIFTAEDGKDAMTAPADSASGLPDTKDGAENKSGSFTDARDGENYDWVLLKDGKKWMAANLNYESKDAWCFDNKPENCKKYGRLYTYAAAMNACPKGWHLPDASEWKTMAKAHGGYYDLETSKLIGKELESFKTLTESGKGNFNGKFGGFRNADDSFYNLGNEGHYWTRSLAEGNYAWSYYFGRVYGFFRWKDADKSLGFSCRCVKD